MVRTVNKGIDKEAIWKELGKIRDPEIPILTLTEMRIIRDVQLDEKGVCVTMSPTFAGCPALDHMRDEIRTRLRDMGCEEVEVRLSFSPPWSTDMLDESTKLKLETVGITPPPPLKQRLEDSLAEPVACPYCHSTTTRVESLFGATLCKQLYFCEACKQPFERFKPV